MTPEWFEDLAERLSEASQFAFFDDEPSMARDFQMARQSALDYAHSTRKAIEQMNATAEAPRTIEPATPAARSRRASAHVA